MFTKITSAVLIAAILGVGTAAVAGGNPGAQSDVGYITEVDKTDRTVTLADGATYTLPFGFDLTSFNAGQKVNLIWDQIGSSKLASSISFTN